MQPTVVQELLQAQNEELLEEEPEQLLIADKGEEQVADDENKAGERLRKITLSNNITAMAIELILIISLMILISFMSAKRGL